MKYPEYNPQRLDTGIRELSIVSLFGEDVKKYGGTHAVFLARLTRRADAITTEGDIWVDDGPSQFLAKGNVADCIAYIEAQPVPENGRVLYDAPGKMIWTDIETERAYQDTLEHLCDSGELLAQMLNYAAAVRNGYAPHAPGYNPHKRPCV